MTVRALIIALAFATLLGGLTACRYSDGPFLNFSKPETRLVNSWKVKKAFLNNQDITSTYEGNFIKFENDGKFTFFDAEYSVSHPPFVADTTLAVNGEGTWQFLNNKTEINLLYEFPIADRFNPAIIYRELVTQKWTIERLTKEELWVKDDSTSIELELLNP